ncbi:hypothetical protein KBZ10_18895 [Streptomyces sp. F63]|uniref:hypothetical protein n=1 Tax=Streptomyces sp. F63 TaxID=2824887 RepID=UPI001B396EAA|nr:hypothetical protein [Streptomyces sp. F63]MBQ0986542.1 hypothetical protein [Streptomyces sp. F63]
MRITRTTRKLTRRLEQHLGAQALLILLVAWPALALAGRESWSGSFGRAVLFTAVGTAVLALDRRRESRAAGLSEADTADLDRKLRHGELPPRRRERVAMYRLLVHRRHRMRHAWIALPALALGIATALAVMVRGAVGAGLFLLTVLLSVAAVGAWGSRRRLTRLRRLEESLVRERERERERERARERARDRARQHARQRARVRLSAGA